MVEEGRYDVVDPAQYEEITGDFGDVPDQIHITNVTGEDVQYQELWTGRDEGRFNTVGVDIGQQLVELAVTQA